MPEALSPISPSMHLAGLGSSWKHEPLAEQVAWPPSRCEHLPAACLSLLQLLCQNSGKIQDTFVLCEDVVPQRNPTANPGDRKEREVRDGARNKFGMS